MGDKKRRQHHVWKYHLAAWARDGQVWCLQDGNTFSSNPDNLAVERDFYRIREIDERDRKAIRWLCVEGRPDGAGRLAERVIEFLEYPYRLIEQVRALAPQAEKEIEMERVEINYVEDFLSHVEDKVVPLIDRMREGDLSCICREEDAAWISYFLAI